MARKPAPRRASKIAALLASLAVPAICGSPALGQQPTYRSVNDVRERIPDEQDRPFVRETMSHRGWEVREDQYTIFTNTSAADARWAAEQVAQARGEAGRLLDRLTGVHRQADFGLNSLQVVIDNEPHRDRNGPLTTIDGVGIQTSVRINVAEGQPALPEQALRLREAGAFAMLHAAGLDAVLPPWAVGGIATHLALRDEPEPLTKPDEFAPEGVPFGGQPWRWRRSAQDVLEEQPLDRNEAAAKVTFLLEGNDAEHAYEFLTLVRDSIAAGQARAAEGNQITRRRGEAAEPPTDTPLDQLVEAHERQFAAWQADPLIGRPVFTPQENDPPELIEQQQEMLVVLKLQRRASQSSVARPNSIKVLTFDRQQGKADAASRSAQPVDIAAVVERIRNDDLPPLATLDVDGRLLLSTDYERIEALLGPDGRRYRSEQAGARRVVATRMEDGRTLHGWLEDNPANPSRPLAKFAVVDPRARPADAKPQQASPASPATTTQRGVKIISR